MIKTAYDVAIVGAGPNGLTGAAVLARAGLAVGVFEANDRIGGSCRTEAVTLPGFAHDICGAIHPMGVLSPIFQRLLLIRFGGPALQAAVGCVERHFSGEAARALFAGCAAHSFVSLRAPGSASFGLVLAVAGQAADWPCAAGVSPATPRVPLWSRRVQDRLRPRGPDRRVPVRPGRPTESVRSDRRRRARHVRVWSGTECLASEIWPHVAGGPRA